MRIKRLTIILLLLPLLGFSQSPMSVLSFERIDNDLDARVHYPLKDQNGKTCAIIKIETTLPLNEFTFDGGTVGVIDSKQKVGEIWLYQSPGSRYISIHHKSHTPLRQYQYSEQLEEATVYVMKLVSATKITTYEEAQTFQYLIIKCDIPGARITINNKEEEAFSDGVFTKRMEFGKYSYEINAPMYFPFVGQFELKNKEKYEFEAKLTPNFAVITINSSPEQGAEVFINNEFKGKTPLVIEKVLIGTNDLLLTKPMYKSYTQKLIVESQKPQNLSVSMLPTFANIDITTDTSSEIFINDSFKSKGNWSGKLTHGHYKLEARKESHQSSIKNIEVEEGKDCKIELSNPTPILGNVDVSSLPEIGADIYIDNKHFGQTPNIIEGILIGERKLRIEKDGFETIERNINIERGKMLEVNIELLLAMKTGSINIISEHDAYIYIDEIYSGQSPKRLTNIIIGKRKLRISKPGFETIEQTIEIEPSKTLELKLKLKKKGEKDSEKLYETWSLTQRFYDKHGKSSLNCIEYSVIYNEDYIALISVLPFRINKLQFSLLNFEGPFAKYHTNNSLPVDISSKRRTLYAPTIGYLIPITTDLYIAPYIKYSVNILRTWDTGYYTPGDYLSVYNDFEVSMKSHEASFGISLEYIMFKHIGIILSTEYRKTLYKESNFLLPEGFYFGAKVRILNGQN